MTSTLDRQQDEQHKLQRAFEREQRKNEVMRSAHTTLADKDVVGALELFIEAGQAFKALGRHTEARTSLMTAMEIALRLYYQAMTGSALCGPVGVSKWAHRLRSRGLLDRESFRPIVTVCEQLAPYDEAYVDDLAGLARSVIAAVLASAGGMTA